MLTEEWIEQVASAVKRALEELEGAKMDLPLARTLIQKVQDRARETGLSVVVAVADEGGNPVAIERMDGAFLASFDIALNKAYTACALKMSTLSLKPMAQPGGQLYGIQHTNGGKIVVFGGGVPLMKSGRLIGGLGVSGGTEAQDSALAEYGASILEEEIACRLTKRN